MWCVLTASFGLQPFVWFLTVFADALVKSVNWVWTGLRRAEREEGEESWGS